MSNQIDLTTGSIARKLFLFSLPIMGSNLLQAVYNIVDMIIVGQFTTTAGMSAISIGGQVTALVLALCTGLSNACAIFAGRLFGMKKQEETQGYVGTMLSFLLILAVVISAAVIVLCDPLLALLKTPAESLRQTRQYLVICMTGTVFVYGYGVFSSALRGVGETLHPLIYVAVTTVENLVLDLLFVAVFQWGAAGAAAATVISQATSFVLVALYTKRRTVLFDFKPRSFQIDSAKLKQLVAMGLPQAIQHLTTNISFLCISSLVNTYGVAASAAAGAASKLGSFGMLPGHACSSAVVTMTAQNHPSRNYKRILRGMNCGILISLSVSVVFFLLCQIFPDAMYAIFTSDPEVAMVGTGYLRLYAICFIDEVVMFCMNSVLIGSGYTTVTMAGSLIISVGIRFTAAYLISQYTALGFSGIALAYSLAPVVGIAIAGFFLLSGKWKAPRIAANEPPAPPHETEFDERRF